MKTFKGLWKHQVKAVEWTHAALEGRPRPSGVGVATRLLTYCATGGGKGVILGYVAIDLFLKQRGRILIVVPDEQLVDQLIDQVRAVAVGRGVDVQIGAVQAARNEVDRDIIVATIQTVSQPLRLAQVDSVTAMICDEAHSSRARTWVQTIDRVGGFGHTVSRRSSDNYTLPGCGCGRSEPHEPTPILGYTATPFRSDEKDLADIFTETVFAKSIVDGVREGWLCNILPAKQITIPPLDLSHVRDARGDLPSRDFTDAEIGEALERVEAADRIAKSVEKHAWYSDGRWRPTIVFMPTRATAREVLREFGNLGVSAELILGTTGRDERTMIINRFASGATRVLVNVMCLKQGFDAPFIGCVAIVRPSKSLLLVTQMIGRGTRRWDVGGKEDLLILDLGRVTEDHGLVDLAGVLAADGIDMAEGETLVEAIQRTDREPRQRTGRRAVEVEELPVEQEGPERVVDVDLLASTPAVLLTSYDGTQFIQTTDAWIILWRRSDGLGLTVARLPRTAHRRTQATVCRTDDGMRLTNLDYEDAVAYAIRIAMAEDPTISGSKAAWRRRKPSPKLKAQLDRIGAVEGVHYRSAGEGSNILAVHFASPIIDRR